MKRSIVIASAALGAAVMISSAIFGQGAPPLKEKREKMAALQFLVGEWEGTGWAQLGPERSTFTQSEKVYAKLGGLVLVVEGRGADEESGAATHEAYATITYDAEAGHYRFDAHTAEGRSTQARAEVGRDSLVWSLDSPLGKVRYTLRLTEEGHWHEIGEGSRDGVTWHRFLEMTLQRVK